MTNYSGEITDFVAGDDLTIERTITTVTSGQTLTNAWFTAKRRLTHTDGQALFQKSITTVLASGVGHIDDSGADGTGHVIFYVTNDDTALMTPYTEYYYDIQVKLSGGTISTPETGVIVAFPQVTLAES